MQVTVQRYDHLLRRRLRRLSRVERPNVEFSGAKEWSDREIGRLDPQWAHRFVLAHTIRKQVFHGVMVTSFALIVAMLALSVTRFFEYAPVYQEEPRISVLDKYKAWCAVHPAVKVCRKGGK